MTNRNEIGDAPIEFAYAETMNALAHGINEILNGKAEPKDRGTAFVLLVSPFGASDGRCNYISNGADRNAVVRMMKGQIERFEGAGHGLSAAEESVLDERARQREMWSAEHDDEHRLGEIACASALYALRSGMANKHGREQADEICAREEILAIEKQIWPWDRKWWKPRDRRRTLVKAAALLIAEIERLDRAAERSANGDDHG